VSSGRQAAVSCISVINSDGEGLPAVRGCELAEASLRLGVDASAIYFGDASHWVHRDKGARCLHALLEFLIARREDADDE
jgi:hypothetical protein